MKSIQIKGLRSLVDTKTINIKPINILVGTNSSGKSTFLRTFPLIRQSIERKTRGPILWNGVYTDFESFLTSIHKNGTLQEETTDIEFEFNFTYKYKKNTYVNKKEEIDILAKIYIKEGTTKNSCYTRKYDLTIYGHKITFDFEEDGTIESVYSNRFNWSLKKSDFKYQRTNTDSLLPIIKLPSINHIFYNDNKNEITKVLYRQILSLLEGHTKSSSDLKIKRLANSLIYSFVDDDEKLKIMRKFSSTKKWKVLVDGWDVHDDEFKFLAGLIDLFSFIERSAEINLQLNDYYRNVRYIAPLRASTERYYRYQDLSIDELEHTGINIGMFLSNIPTRKWKSKLNAWTMDNFGFKINEKVNSSHIAIELEYGTSNISDNIADMGFGFSQILPIIVQLWSVASGYESSIKNTENKTVIFAIEQPELHLHPKMQAALAKVFSLSIELAKENEVDLKLIIETHSPTMISKFGDLIAENKYLDSDLSIILFEQDREIRETEITISKFDCEGELEKWPADFFTY